MRRPWVAAAVVLPSTAIFVMFRLNATEQDRFSFQFRDAGGRAGLKGVTVCGKQRKTSVIEVNGSGLCWFDYNNDGLLDLYVVNGGTMDDLQANKNGGPGVHR